MGDLFQRAHLPANALAGLEGKQEGNNDKGFYRLFFFLRLFVYKMQSRQEKIISLFFRIYSFPV